MKAPYPKIIIATDTNESVETTFAQIQKLIHAIRNIRAEMQIAPNEKTDLFIFSTSTTKDLRIAQEHQDILTSLTPTAKITFTDKDILDCAATAIVGELKLLIPI